MNDKLQKIYDLYITKGLITAEGTPFDKWAKANERQQLKLFELGQKEGLFSKETPAEAFTAIWGVKKKDESQPTAQEVVTESDTSVAQVQPGSSGSSPVDAQFEDTVSVDFEGPEAQLDSTPSVGVDFDAPATEFNPFPVTQDPDLREAQFKAGRRRRGQEDERALSDFSTEKDTAIERTFGKNEFTDFFGDLWRAGSKGFQTGNTVDEALELMAKGSSASAMDVADFVRVNEELNNLGPSDEMRAFNKAYEEAGGGAWGFLKGVMAAPTSITEIAVTSVSQMLNPASLAAAGAVVGTGATGGAAVGSAAGGVGAIPGAAAGAIGSIPYAVGAAGAALESGLSFAEFLQEELSEKGLTFNEENVAKVLNDPDAMFNIRAKAAGRGAIIGVIDGLTAGVASKVAKGVGKTALKAGKTAKRTNLAMTGASTLVEGVGGGVGEAAARLGVGQDLDAAEIGFEMVGGAPGSAITMARQSVGRGKYKMGPDGADITRDEMIKLITEADDATFAGAKLEIKGDEVLKELASERKEKLKKKSAKNVELKSSLEGLNVEQANEAVELEIELEELTGLKSIGAGRKKKEITARLEAIYDAAGQAVETVADESGAAEEVAAIDARLNEITNQESFTEQDIAEKNNLEARKEALQNQQQDAVQESSTTEVDVQEQTQDSETVGEGDTAGGVTVESESETEVSPEATPEEVEQGANDLGELLGALGEAMGDNPVNLGDGARGRNRAEDQSETGAVDATDITATEEGEAVGGTDIITTEEIDQTTVEVDPNIQPDNNNIVVEDTDNHTIEIVQSVDPEGNRVTAPPRKGKRVKQGLTVVDNVEGAVDSHYDSDNYKTENPDQTPAAHEQRITRIADKALKAIQKIFPDVNFVLHRSDQTYKDHVSKESRGAYRASTNTIHINVPKADALTIAHEVFHAILKNKLGEEGKIQDVSKRMLKRLKKVIKTSKNLTKEEVLALEDYASNFEGNIQNEEFLAEFVGYLAATYKKLDAPAKNTVREWIQSILDLIGLDINIGDISKDDRAVIDLLNVIAEKVTTGEEISAQDLQALDEGGSINVGEPGPIQKAEEQAKRDKQFTQEQILEGPKDAKTRKVTFPSKPGPLSFVTEQDKIDINSLIDTIIENDEKVWFWTADQLGRGEYGDVVVDKQHYLDAGPSYALDPENRKKGIIWASGLGKNRLQKGVDNSDYIFIMSGAPQGSQMFNKQVFNVLEERINQVGGFAKFKKAVMGANPVKAVREIMAKHDSFDSLKSSTDRKKLLSAFASVEKKKDTPLKRTLEKFNAFLDMDSMRDSFYRDNDFKQNDVMIVLKPTGVGEKSAHSTYTTDILGEVVGVPDVVIDAADIATGDARAKIDSIVEQKGKRRSVESQVIAPYGTGPGKKVRKAPKKKAKKTEVKKKPAVDTDVKTRAIVKNTRAEVKRLKDLNVKSEDGATLNIDGTKYTGGGLVVPAASINTTQSELTPQMIEKFIADNQGKIGEEGIVKVGLYKFPGSDQVSIDLNIVVPGENREAALEFGRLAGQESLFDLDTFENVKTGATGANPISFTDAQFRQIAKDLKGNKVPKVFEGDVKTQKIMSTNDRLRTLGRQYNMNNNGFTPSYINLAAFQNAARKLGFGVKKARGPQGGYYFTRNGSKVNVMQDMTKTQIFDKGMSVGDVIKFARENNFTDAMIKDYLVRIKKMKVKEVNGLLSLDADMFRRMPAVFGDIKGGAKAGMKLFKKVLNFNEKLKKRNEKRKTKLTEAEMMDATIEFMEKQPEFQAEGDTKTIDSKKQMEMIVGLQKAMDSKPTKKMNTRIRGLRKSILDRKRGAKNLQKVKAQLRNFIRQTLPSVKGSTYTRSELMGFVRKVTNATEANIDTIMDEVFDFVTDRQVKTLDAKIESILNGKYEVLQSGRKKGVKIDTDTRNRLKVIKELVTDEAATADDIVKSNQTLNAKIAALQEKVVLTDQEVDSIVDMQIVMALNNSKLMDNVDINKVESLSLAEELLSGVIGEARETFKEQLQADHKKYVKNQQDIHFAITGEKIDLSTEEGQKRYREKQNIDARKKEKDRAKRGYKKVLSLVSNAMNWMGRSHEGLTGLMDILQKIPSDVFPGKTTKELVNDPVNEGSRVFKKRQMENRKTIINKVKEIYGKKWRKKSKLNAAPKGTGVYVNQDAVNKAQEKYDADKSRKNKLELNKVKQDNEITLSPNQIGYLHNQYNDPANIASFANEKNKNFGPDHARIMQELRDSVDPEVLEMADWMVNEFYPGQYDHYDAAYQKIYRTNLPWNEQYGGRIYREGNVPEPLDLLGQKSALNNQVGAASTKVRQATTKPIMAMDMMDTMMTYTNDMEWFAAMGPVLRDINKLFNNPDVRQTIESAHGKNLSSLIDFSLKQLAARGVNTEGQAKFINVLNDFFINTRLGLNPTVMLKQLTSFMAYADLVGYGNYMKYAVKNKAEFLKVFKEIRDNSVYLQDRMSGDIRKQLESYSGRQDVPFMPKGSGYFQQMMMGFVKAGDIGAIYLGGMPAYSYYKAEFKKNNPNATEQEAIDHAIRKFEFDTKETQQSGDIQDKDWWQQQGAVTRSMQMFVSAPRQLLRQSFKGLRMMKKGLFGMKGQGLPAAAKEFGKGARKFFTFHAVLPMMFQYVALGLPGLLRGADEEDEQDMLRAGILGAFNSMFAIGDVLNIVADTVQEKPWAGSFRAMPLSTTVAELSTLFTRWEKTKDEAKKAELQERLIARALELGINIGTGGKGKVPFYNIKKMIDNYSKLGEGDDPGKDILRLFNYGEYTIERGAPEPAPLEPAGPREDRGDRRRESRSRESRSRESRSRGSRSRRSR